MNKYRQLRHVDLRLTLRGTVFVVTLRITVSIYDLLPWVGKGLSARSHVACNPGMRQCCDYLPCNTVSTIFRRAGATKDSILFCTIPLWITVSCMSWAGIHFSSHLAPTPRWCKFLGGRSPFLPAFSGAAAPRAPPPPTSYAGAKAL